MPGRPDATERRQPALDGLRAVAVVLVVAYHGGVPGLSTAGYFGVDVFFVLSGYLITSLLLHEQAEHGRIQFGRFWARRARRLLPGLVLMLAAVDLYVVRFAPAGSYPAFRADALSVIAYFSNWHFIAASSNYFATSASASLLTHTWSLAIEEQFYVIWPLLLWGMVSAARRTGRRPGTTVAIVSAAGAAASAAWMAYLFRSGAGLSRLYYGTDTHAQSILIGAALAGAIAVRPAWFDRLALPLVTMAAFAGLVWAACTLGYSDPVTYQGGFLLVAVLSALVLIATVRRPAAAPAAALSRRPVAYIGRISYGMYLWYFPLFAVIDHARTGLTGPSLFLVRLAADVALAATSFHLIEQPVRRWTAGFHPRRSTIVSLGTGAAALAGVAGLVLVDSTPAYSIGAPAIPAAAAMSDPGAQRILVVGDSTGMTLGLDLSWPEIARHYGYSIYDRAIVGCGVALSDTYLDHGSVGVPPPACRASTAAAGRWPAMLQADLSSYRPQLVLLVSGRWEVRSEQLKAGGPWTDITQPADAAYIRSQFELAASMVSSAHAVLGLATAPCYSSGETPAGGTWPEDDPARVDAYNRIVRSVVAAHPGQVRLVDLNAMVCPGGRYHATIDGVTLRTDDGVHFPFFSTSAPNAPDPDTVAQCQAFGAWITPKILAALR
ncbi:MAG TPA: acyltransferase family protein [Acidimicrobiales bacterium]|nr:acyltransferase family protein [Acidimicrobiales bacterium]